MDSPRLSQDKVNEIASHYEAILRLIGEDPNREGLKKTPLRAAKALAYITDGYRQDIDHEINNAFFSHEGSKMVIVKDIEFYSLCEHHILPFFGKMTIAYIPQGKTIGLSKIARIVDYCARRLQVQERITSQVCNILQEKLSPQGVIAMCSAEHLCMKMRGVEKQNSSTVTYETTGVFTESQELREEFFRAVSCSYQP